MKTQKRYKYGNKNTNLVPNFSKEIKSKDEKLEKLKNNEKIDNVYGFKYRESVGGCRRGWLMNMKASESVDEENRVVSAMDYFFLEEDGGRFKATLRFPPYFYVATSRDCESEVSSYLRKKFGESVKAVESVEKEDLELDNHLSGLRRRYVKVSFYSMDDLCSVRRELLPRVAANKKRLKEKSSVYANLMANHLCDNGVEKSYKCSDTIDKIVDIREHDVPYLVRSSIDLSMFVGSWYEVRGSRHSCSIVPRPDLVDRPEPVVLAYDIETTKLPLKFPDSAFDQVMMISYMVDGLGYLICNRDLIAADIEDFEFTPRPEFPGPFMVFNEMDEKATLERFFEHVREVRPNVIVTYNGDSFDWPFVENRAKVHGLDLAEHLGFERDSEGEYKSRCCLHMDCYRWVQRDSYLPIGSQGLKAVCKAKLHYDPVEVDPEEMCSLARDQPRTLANYSVSDAVATYYLYMKYVHPFIFALCTIIPLEPDEVLRKGSGTLCESLLMVQAHLANIIFPNKQDSQYNRLTADGHLLDSETYVGGHVEAIESGVFRADIATKFRLVPEMCQNLRDSLEHTLKHALVVEEKVDMSTVLNFDEVLSTVEGQLKSLQQVPNRMECPVIYHLDVAAMYPNIILSNRLQPSAVMKTSDNACASCDHNGPSAKCKRPMQWMWRGEVMPATKSEYFLIQSQLEKEKFPPRRPGEPERSFHNLSKEERAAAERDRLGKYCRTAYKKSHITRVEERTSIVCQKENSFYVDTVRSFRDRRYEFKDLTKLWKKTLDRLVASKVGDPGEIKRASGMLVLYDSLQLAHKCILNSFYGYVMRKGARWYSMEMAGIVCSTGAEIIKNAREIIEQIGRPLELDTDGIWCILPCSFPENVTFETSSSRGSVTVSYPGAMLNVMVQSQFTNDQYHELVDPQTRRYEMRSENSIFFEVDGPYKAMVLPAAKEQGKRLKKRYAVFNMDNSLAELKGFEVKRNGELNLIKIFQSSVFEAFLRGSSLQEVYGAVAVVADRWLDVLHSRGANSSDEELLELLSEKRCMSRRLAEYGTQKSTCLSTARRLAEFLGDDMVKEAGLSFRFVISKKPEGLTVTERAVPLAIFKAEPAVRRHYLSKWLRVHLLEEDRELDLRELLDWSYYIDRFNSNVQKIITIPAALQHVDNPVPRVPHPDWLHKKLMEKEDTFKQRKIDDMFTKRTVPMTSCLEDLENIAPRVPHKRQAPPPSPEKEIGHWKEKLVEKVPSGSDTQLWLAYHKRKWAVQQEIRSRQRLRPAAPPPQKLSRLTNFLSYTKQSKSMLDETWQIVQIVETTTTPGVHKMWVLIGQQLHCLRLSIPRTFYVNTRIAKQSDEDNLYFKKVHKILPRSHIVYYLYEYNIAETVFIEHSADIRMEFVKNEVEGVYELEVPLLFRALVKLGCLCTVDSNFNRRRQTAETTFQLSDLKFRSLSQQPYLENCTSVFKTVLLLHYKSGTNQIMALFLPAANKALFCIIDPNKAANHSRFSKQLASQLNMTVDIITESREQSCFKSISKLLATYKSMPSIIVTISNIIIDNGEKLSEKMKGLSDFPVIVLPFVDLHNDNPINFSALFNWQEAALKCAVDVFLNYEAVLESQLERARYLHVPLGNLSMFPLETMSSCDLMFARHLLRSDHVLWCHRDTGGKATVDRRQSLIDVDLPPIEHNEPGSYPSVSLQLDISYIVIGTILSTDKIQDIDGTNSRLFDSLTPASRLIDDIFPHQQQQDPRRRNLNLNTTISSYDDTVAAAPAFRVLRKMFIEWINDVKLYRNQVADEHIVHFYKWLTAPSSLLYDPALHKTLDKLTRKLFFKLIEQLTNLGLDVVYGNLNRVIVCTRRTDLLEALLHVEYATKTIRSQEIFSVLDFQYSASWDFLLWQETANYSGIRADWASLAHSGTPQDPQLSFLDLSQQQQNSQVFSTTDPRDPARLELCWHLQRYLSPDTVIQWRFEEIISEFMFSISGILRDEYNIAQLSKTTVAGAPSMGHDSSLYQTTIEKIDNFLQLDIANKLYSFISNINNSSKYLKKVILNEDETLPPLLPLKRNYSQYPLVDLVNTICHILSLDKNASKYSNDWKRNMLKILGVGEYSECSIWRSPYSRDPNVPREVACKGELLVIVPELICDHCSMVRDLDICRDRYCRQLNETWCFICPGCEKSYNKDVIETALVDQLHNLTELALLQDLRCNKCPDGIIETVLAGTRNCKKCAGSLECTRSAALLEQQVTVYGDLGKYYDMEYLRCVALWMLRVEGAR